MSKLTALLTALVFVSLMAGSAFACPGSKSAKKEVSATTTASTSTTTAETKKLMCDGNEAKAEAKASCDKKKKEEALVN